MQHYMHELPRAARVWAAVQAREQVEATNARPPVLEGKSLLHAAVEAR